MIHYAEDCSKNKTKMLAAIITLSIIFNFELTSSFNFDTDFPIVYNNLINSTRSSFFGYSVILHSSPAWIQIGAPRANSSEIYAIEPGVIFKCNIYGPCAVINVDTQSGLGASYQGSFRDKKDKAWIGGAMDIDFTADRVVVCAHRWINDRIQDYWMLGACYWSHANETLSDKLIPLLDNGKGIILDSNAKVNVYYYGQGQAGMAAHFSKNQNESELILGAPGVYNWDGTTLMYTDGPDSAPVASKWQQPSKRDLGYSEFSNVNIANAMTTTQTASFGLFGYSVTSGYFFDSDKILYVTGAPRSRNLAGQILVYEFVNASDQALEVKDSKQGYQYGEYFGSALCAGDINEDGYDDLVVGAPFYSSSKYNEGRIFIYMGSEKGSLETPQQNQVIEGKAIAGQFGSCVMFLGDIHRDGYSDIAVGAPYENDHSGVVYIYRGNLFGLDGNPSQRIVGKDFAPDIRGFGISMSRPTDIDMNYYNDLAIGAYLSEHVVLLRSKPVVTLQQSVISLTPRLEHNAEFFVIKACFWYTGFHVPPTILITRKIVVDELLLRAYLLTTIPGVRNMTLKYDDITCENVTISIMKDLSNRYDPLTVTVSQDLVIFKNKSKAFHVGTEQTTEQVDDFCKNCSILNPIRSFKEQKLELTFVLGCGDDNICKTKLNLQSKFLNISADNRYVLGSTNYLKLEVTITNNGEKAYLTQVIVDLPRSVFFRSIPISCVEQNSSTSICCNIDNPLYESKSKSIVLDLDMKEVNSGNYGNKLEFKMMVLTSSENSNNNVFIETLNTTREADMQITGKSGEQSYTYRNTTKGMSNFTQNYQIEKFGVSTIDEVFLEIKIPTHIIYKKDLIRMVQLYTPEGYHAQQPIHCDSNVRYIFENAVSDVDFDVEAIRETDQVYLTTTTENSEDVIFDSVTVNNIPLNNHLKHRQRRAVSEDGIISNSLYPFNRTLYINCSNEDVVCARVSCTIGPFKSKQQSAVLQLKMLMNVSSISGLLGKKDIIIFATEGMVSVKNPKNFIQTGNRPDIVSIPSVFIGDSSKEKLETWIIIVAAIAGLLLLLLLIMGLIKAGFFRRKKKQELAALKEAEEVQQFQQNAAQSHINEDMDFDIEDCEFEDATNHLHPPS